MLNHSIYLNKKRNFLGSDDKSLKRVTKTKHTEEKREITRYKSLVKIKTMTTPRTVVFGDSDYREDKTLKIKQQLISFTQNSNPQRHFMYLEHCRYNQHKTCSLQRSNDISIKNTFTYNKMT